MFTKELRESCLRCVRGKKSRLPLPHRTFNDFNRAFDNFRFPTLQQFVGLMHEFGQFDGIAFFSH